MPATYAKPEDFTGAPIVLIGKIDKLQPIAVGFVQLWVRPSISTEGFDVKDLVSITQKKHLGLHSLDFETVYFFPLQRESSGYVLRDGLVPLPLSPKAAIDGIAPKLKDLNGVKELLLAVLGSDSPKASGLALMHLGSLNADVPLDQLRPLYESPHAELALGAIYCGIRLGDPKALYAIGVNKTLAEGQNADPSMKVYIENAILKFPPEKVDGEILLAAVQGASPKICEKLLGLAAQASPEIAVPVAMSALLKDDPNVAYQGVRTLMTIYGIESGPLRVSAPKFKKDPKKYIQMWQQFVQEQMTP